jgi:hypothetical protein
MRAIARRDQYRILAFSAALLFLMNEIPANKKDLSSISVEGQAVLTTPN